MKIVITGHTKGLGKAIYDHFSNQGHELIGLSRSNGYSLPDKINEVVDIAKGCDVFFNNAYSGLCQITLTKELYTTTPIVISGSIAADYYVPGNEHFIGNKNLTNYFSDKFELEKSFKFLKKIRKHPMLLLKMGYLENFPDKRFIPFSQILDSIDFWIKNPRATIIEFDNLS
jgi:NADP-dependent 3-hydroxy acid dehydrogenase YdfG